MNPNNDIKKPGIAIMGWTDPFAEPAEPMKSRPPRASDEPPAEAPHLPPVSAAPSPASQPPAAADAVFSYSRSSVVLKVARLLISHGLETRWEHAIRLRKAGLRKKNLTPQPAGQ